MSRLSMLALLALGVGSLVTAASAEFTGSDESIPTVANPRLAQELRSRARRLGTSSHVPNDTTYVGFNPAYAGSNYWSIGVGHRWPRGAYGPGKGDIPPVPNDDTGYWDWDHPVHGDSLQGWWPVRHMHPPYPTPVLNDKLRPRHAIDIGNSVSYVISQGTGYQRTFGVTSAWHVDPGVNGKTPDPDPVKSDVNPKPPRWTPIAGSRSAWCGLRAHGDIAVVDPVTGNPYNVDALGQVMTTSAVASFLTRARYPGYASQWDQMLYRDIDISDTTLALSSASVSVSFRYRTRMSTTFATASSARTGWFDKDPLAVVAGNFISASDAGAGAPIDSFMVYVGSPVADTVGASWTGSDGMTHQVFDPVRRWFGELIRANQANGHYELFTTYGNRPPIAVPADSNAFAIQTATRNITYGQLRAAWGNRIRLVFRIKTNRGLETPSSDDTGSISASYSSGYLGAAQLDDVSINLGGATVPLGGFENESDIDNHPGATALASWKTSSKPPGIHFHVHDLSSLVYDDLCGAPGAVNRICDMAGNVISMGDHDRAEEASGPSGTAENDQFDGIFSPTINLAFDPGNPTAKNNMGIDAASAVPTYDFAIAFNIYAGFFDIFTTGQSYQAFAQSYPALQSDGTRTWGEATYYRYNNWSTDKQCYDQLDETSLSGFVRTSNANGVPDSIRIGLLKRSECYRFGLTATCGGTAGGYYDNVSLALIDSHTAPLAVQPWDFWNDTFPANETAGLPGTAAFDTTAALIKSGYNISALLDGYDVPGDTTLVAAPGDSVEVQLVFRILSGPGNYVVPGDACSGLRRVPSDSTRISAGDGSFWTEYILNPGKETDGFPTAGPCKGGGPLRHDQRWSELVWCNARCDTAEQNLFPVQGGTFYWMSGSNPVLGRYASMYHEEDKHLATLGLPRHKCFLVDTVDHSTNITCSNVPAWVTAGGLPYRSGYNGNPITVEGTKVIPDGLLTPGSHVEYFYVKKDLATGAIAMCPDTSAVYPQQAEGSLDAHRWQQFSVLPDAWKFGSYGGLGKACMLYVDWSDRLGEERAWVSVADSIGATAAARRGSHNGWSAPGGADINDPAYFVNRNAQPGTTWDMYGVKGSEAGDAVAGMIGARLTNRTPGGPITDKWAKNAPTLEMLSAYYPLVTIMTGQVYWNGTYSENRVPDAQLLSQYLGGATAESHRGLWCMGDRFVEDTYYSGSPAMVNLLNLLGVTLRNASFVQFSGDGRRPCIDLIPTAAITTSGDIYGLRNSCLSAPDVLSLSGDAVPASYYDPVGANPVNAPYIAGAFTDAETANNPTRHFQTLVDGWSLSNLRSRFCDTSYGRLAYMWNVFNNVFAKLCAVAGTGPQTTEVPNNGDGRTFVDLAGIGNNPLRQGSAVIHLTLAQADRVTVRIYDVSGRRVRTLADGQMFKAGRVDPALTWDGLDDSGRRVARGAYFVSVRYQNSRYAANRKMIVLR